MDRRRSGLLARVSAPACVLALSLGLAPSASACAPMIRLYVEPPPGTMYPQQWEAQQAYLEKLRAERDARALQSERWDKSEQVVLARIEKVSPRQVEKFWGGMADVKDVELRPVRWLKGAGEDQPFTLSVLTWSDCGPEPQWDALWGKPGGEFVVYVTSGRPSQTSVTEAMAPKNLLDPRAKKAVGVPPQ